MGLNELTFLNSESIHSYHFCFLIRSNKIFEVLEWSQKRGNVLAIENQRKILNFTSWNAPFFYLYDASGNRVEFMVKHDLDSNSYVAFSSQSIL
jgi:hypothetical protein